MTTISGKPPNTDEPSGRLKVSRTEGVPTPRTTGRPAVRPPETRSQLPRRPGRVPVPHPPDQRTDDVDGDLTRFVGMNGLICGLPPKALAPRATTSASSRSSRSRMARDYGSTDDGPDRFATSVTAAGFDSKVQAKPAASSIAIRSTSRIRVGRSIPAPERRSISTPRPSTILRTGPMHRSGENPMR